MQSKPEITISPSRVTSGEQLIVKGTGFTPNRSALSHLLRPDETEYNPLRLRIDQRGEFVHKIDSTMLHHGMFEMWVEDETSKVLSNRVRFTVDSSER